MLACALNEYRVKSVSSFQFQHGMLLVGGRRGEGTFLLLTVPLLHRLKYSAVPGI